LKLKVEFNFTPGSVVALAPEAVQPSKIADIIPVWPGAWSTARAQLRFVTQALSPLTEQLLRQL
jgi:hypothetical protein